MKRIMFIGVVTMILIVGMIFSNRQSKVTCEFIVPEVVVGVTGYHATCDWPDNPYMDEVVTYVEKEIYKTVGVYTTFKWLEYNDSEGRYEILYEDDTSGIQYLEYVYGNEYYNGAWG